jgi:PPOX class probable F420-dependent enzyme
VLEIPAKLSATVKRRLKDEYFAWFTTVGTDLSPQPRPIWFIWEEQRGSVLIYSQPHAHKVRHLARHPNVALHFNADATGDTDILVFIGKAEIDPEAPPAHKVPAYVNKYREGIAGLNMTPEELGREYSVAIRVTPISVRDG